MAAVEESVVVCTYTSHRSADDLVAVFREKGIPVAVVPSSLVEGAWDVVVPGQHADPATGNPRPLLDPE